MLLISTFGCETQFLHFWLWNVSSMLLFEQCFLTTLLVWMSSQDFNAQWLPYWQPSSMAKSLWWWNWLSHRTLDHQKRFVVKKTKTHTHRHTHTHTHTRFTGRFTFRRAAWPEAIQPPSGQCGEWWSRWKYWIFSLQPTFLCEARKVPYGRSPWRCFMMEIEEPGKPSALFVRHSCWF